MRSELKLINEMDKTDNDDSDDSKRKKNININVDDYADTGAIPKRSSEK